MSEPLKTRFAPSPTGWLHLGNIRTALFNYLLARGAKGRLLLRIEDTDAMRGHEQYTKGLMRDLEWLGLEWDEGPQRGGPAAPYEQSQRGEIYRRYFDALETAGLVYSCFCTEQELKVERKTQIAAGQPPRYSGKCRRLSAADIGARRKQNLPATLRFRVEEARTLEFTDRVRGLQRFATSDIGDFVIRRSDGTPAFFFCNAVDDALMGVTLVVRGEDHLTNTPRQLLLLEALKLRAPAYAHIPLVVGADGAPLSKRTGSKSVQELREAGLLPLAINNYLARVGHTYDDNRLLSMPELSARFDLGRVHHSPARFDEVQLLHWQREAVRHASIDELWAWVGEAVANIVPAADRHSFVEAVRGNARFPSDMREWAERIYSENLPYTSDARESIRKAGRSFFEHVASVTDASADLAMLMNDVSASTGLKAKQLYQPLRSALTGQIHGTEMNHILSLIGRERVLRRLQAARDLAGG
jgi:nondiscriminating glutamyl-tRNA synthetase